MPKRGRSAGNGACHRHGPACRQRRDRGHELHVLAAVGQLDAKLMQRAHGRRGVAGLHALPQEGDLRKRIRQAGHEHEVVRRGRPAHIGLGIEELGGAAVDGQVAVAAVEGQVAGRVPGGQHIPARGQGDRGLDEPRRHPHALAIDPCPGRREPGPHGRRADGHARLGEDAERCPLHGRQGVRRQWVERGDIVKRKGVDRRVRHRAPPGPRG